MKKILLVLLVFGLIFTFAACGNGDTTPAATPTPAYEEAEPYEPEPVEDEDEDEPATITEDADSAYFFEGPITATLGNVQFDLPAGWNFTYNEESNMFEVIARGSIAIITRPSSHTIEDVNSADLLVTIPAAMKNMILNALTGDEETQDMQTFLVNDFQHPAVMSLYFGQFRGEWTDASSIVFFGEEEHFSAHFFTGPTSPDDIIDDWMALLESVRFIS